NRKVQISVGLTAWPPIPSNGKPAVCSIVAFGAVLAGIASGIGRRAAVKHCCAAADAVLLGRLD
ncbi:MAG: hypothetical protein PUC94_08520, partial [Bacteroidales bacterium]|nr:hypothetical protein [Bacteroidales bacterium]